MSGTAGNDRRMQVVMLGLGAEVFAVEADMVREIIDPVPVTRVAGARPHLASVINVRGNVIPLADLRSRFGMAETDASPDTRIVVLEIPIGGDPVVVGMVADRVYEVTEIAEADTQPAPRIGMAWRPEFVRGIAKWNDAFVILPDLEAVLN